MAGCVHVVWGPAIFLLAFLIAKVIALLSEIKKEDIHMIQKAAVSSGKLLWSYVSKSIKRLISSWEVHLPYRETLLTSTVRIRRKGNEIMPNKAFKRSSFALRLI